MKRVAQRPVTETRQPHTIYLTAEIWATLERTHLQARLAGTDPASKIEFIEEVLKLGMQVMAKENPISPRLTEDPSAQHTPQAPVPASRDRNRRRPSPVERLLQASDPGRPAPIPSVATQGGDSDYDDDAGDASLRG